MVISKGASDTQAVAWVLSALKELGMTDETLKVYPESALAAFADAVAEKRTHKTPVEKTPRRSTQSFGGVGSFQRALEGQCRSLKLQF